MERRSAAVLKVIWLAAEQPCGKRLKAAIGALAAALRSKNAGSLHKDLRGAAFARLAQRRWIACLPPARASSGKPRALRHAAWHLIANADTHPHGTLGCCRPWLAGGRYGGALRRVDGWRLLLERDAHRRAYAVDGNPGDLEPWPAQRSRADPGGREETLPFPRYWASIPITVASFSTGIFMTIFGCECVR